VTRVEMLAKTKGGWKVRVVRGRRVVWSRDAGTIAELRRALEAAASCRRAK
jgi:hypothetical protein